MAFLASIVMTTLNILRLLIFTVAIEVKIWTLKTLKMLQLYASIHYIEY